MGVDTDCVVVVAVVITAYGAMVDTAETTMEGGDSRGAGGSRLEWSKEGLGGAGRHVEAGLSMAGGGVERAELVTVRLVFEFVIGWSQPGW